MSFSQIFNSKLQSLKDAHLYRRCEQSNGITFAHNDYLALSTRPEFATAARDAVEIAGAGSKGSRLLGGHSFLLESLEEEVAQFFGSPASLVFSSGYLANLGVLQVLGECAEHTYSDELNHASLIDGIRNTQRLKTVVRHDQWDSISSIIPSSVFVTESLYSMDGDCVDMEGFSKAVRESRGFALIDEAHAAGIFKESGKGLCEGLLLDWTQHARTVTFGKAFGVQGAAILCSKELKELLINRARTFIYSTAPAPVLAQLIRVAICLVREAVAERKELWSRAQHARRELSAFLPPPQSEWEEKSPILPVLVPGEENALRFAQSMRESGIDVRAIRYPTVAKGTERIRLSLNLHISRENTEISVQCLKQLLTRGLQ